MTYDGDLIAQVFSEHERFGTWYEKWVYISTSPPNREEDETTTGDVPTFRTKSEAAS